MKLLVGLFLIFLSWNQPFAHSSINPEIIALIESRNNPNAFNARSGARGLYQITPICLQHYNNIHSSNVRLDSLFDPTINKKVASWYLGWLAKQLKDDDKVLVGFNWGIAHAYKWNGSFQSLPSETRKYLTKYHKLEKKANGMFNRRIL